MIRAVKLVVACVSAMLCGLLLGCSQPGAGSGTALLVASVTPAEDADFVRPDVVIVARISEALDSSSVTTAAVQLENGSGGDVDGNVSYDSASREIRYVPSSNLAEDETFTVTIRGVTDLDGTELTGEYSWSFTTLTEGTVDLAWLQYPVNTTAPIDSNIEFYAKIYSDGLTNQSTEADPDERLLAQIGFGPDGSDPSGVGWTWFDATPNISFTHDSDDEYQATVTAPSIPGNYDTAVRFSFNSGMSWSYWDTESSSLAYAPSGAGNLTINP